MNEQNDFLGKDEGNSLSQFNRLYRQYAPGMLFYARKFVDFQTAEDIIVHDVFLKLWSNNSRLINLSSG
jgi:DNA-directed RNA polymerase specialized sigma24 family protein